MNTMNFNEAVKSVFSKYAVFKGRARRSEYWWFMLFTILAALLLGIFPKMVGDLFSIATFIPGLTVMVRRLHDIGKSGWHALLFYIPFIVFMIFTYTYLSKLDPDDIYNTMPGDFRAVFIISSILTSIASIYMLVLLCTDSQPRDNEYGPNPKTGISSEDLDSIGNNHVN
jgi:uncharacterized membrane protein YhaH (DUF805 family)